jgi:predicted DNA-binding transcriptional regulator YafY
MKTMICAAISDKKALRFLYDGDGERIVEPYCFGESQTGVDVLRAYQTRGYSSSGTPQGWRLFDVSKIANLTILEDEPFAGERKGYNPNDSIMVRFYCRLPE